jgi:hypothetical protein
MNRWLLALCLLAVAGEARADDDELGTSRELLRKATLAARHRSSLPQSGGYLGSRRSGPGWRLQIHLNVTGYYGWVPEEVAAPAFTAYLAIHRRASRLRLDDGAGCRFMRGGRALRTRPRFLPGRARPLPVGLTPPTGIRALAVVGSELELDGAT